MAHVDVSIIIVNYNTCKLTLQCIASIYQQTKGISFEVIVVDNDSSDGSADKIAAQFPGVNLIRSKTNTGFGKANNLGARQAKGKYLFLLNSDTVLIENTVKVQKDFLAQTKGQKIGVIGCNMLDANRQPITSYGNFPSIFQELFEYGFSKIFRDYYKSKVSIAVTDNSKAMKEVDYIIGAAMFFEKDTFNAFGGFDEDFFLYFEETEFCYRMAGLGYKVIWNPDTAIIHYVSASGKNGEGINYRIVEEFYKSKRLYFKKCHGKLTASVINYLSVPKVLINYRHFNMRKILRILLNSSK